MRGTEYNTTIASLGPASHSPAPPKVSKEMAAPVSGEKPSLEPRDVEFYSSNSSTLYGAWSFPKPTQDLLYGLRGQARGEENLVLEMRKGRYTGVRPLAKATQCGCGTGTSVQDYWASCKGQ